MLSAASGLETDADEAIQLFSTSTALFVENQGQWADEEVRYGFNGDGVNIAFTDDGLAFRLSQREEVGSEEIDGDGILRDRFDNPDDYITHNTQFTVQFDGANGATPVGLEQSETYFNYFIGDASTHRSNVHGYETVAYENLYAGIDLHTFGRRDSLKYEFYVAPGADYQQIEVSYDGINGLWIDDAGSLHVETELGQLVDDAPYIYQIVGGEQTVVAGQFSLVDEDTYTFEITGAYDPNLELVIDPDLAWATYLGGSGEESGWGIAVDAAGSALVTGGTVSTDFASANNGHHGGNGDAFVAKVTSGGAVDWATYLGGSYSDKGRGIAVDAAGSALVTGSTSSTNFASANNTNHGYNDAFVAKIDLLPGDFDTDGDVDGGDFLAWQRGFGIPAPNATKSDGDADGDRDVDGDDLTVWQGQFGTGSAPLIVAASMAIEPAFVSSLGSETAALTDQPLSAELVDAAIAMDLSLQLKPGARFRSHATLQDDNFDWISRRARWGQPPAWRGTSEIADHSFRGQSSKINEGRFYHGADDAVDVELLDKLFAESGLVELL